LLQFVSSTGKNNNLPLFHLLKASFSLRSLKTIHNLEKNPNTQDKFRFWISSEGKVVGILSQFQKLNDNLIISRED